MIWLLFRCDLNRPRMRLNYIKQCTLSLLDHPKKVQLLCMDHWRLLFCRRTLSNLRCLRQFELLLKVKTHLFHSTEISTSFGGSYADDPYCLLSESQVKWRTWLDLNLTAITWQNFLFYVSASKQSIFCKKNTGGVCEHCVPKFTSSPSSLTVCPRGKYAKPCLKSFLRSLFTVFCLPNRNFARKNVIVTKIRIHLPLQYKSRPMWVSALFRFSLVPIFLLNIWPQ